MTDGSDKKKKKRPTAQKREMQNKKCRMRNRMFRAKVKTSIKRFTQLLTQEDQQLKIECFSDIASLVDKGVNKNIFKKNKASRIKARLSVLLHAS